MATEVNNTATSSQVPGQFPFALNGTPYQLAEMPTHATLPKQRDVFTAADEGDERSFNQDGYWLRNQRDWGFGAGQPHFDEQDSARPRNRFWHSLFLDIWDDERGLALLPQTDTWIDIETEASPGNWTADLELFEAAGSIAYVTNDEVNWWDGAAWVASTQPGNGQDVTSLVTRGSTGYASRGSGANQVPRSGTVGAAFGVWSNFGTETPDRLWIANGKLIATEAHEVYELDSVGALLGTKRPHPSGAGTWVSVVGSSRGIFAAHNQSTAAGGESAVWWIGIDSSGQLDVPVVAATMPIGETINQIIAWADLVIICTSRGVRVAVATTGQSGASELVVGSTIELTVDAGTVYTESLEGCLGAAIYGPYLYFLWSGFRDPCNTSLVYAGLGRMRLDRSIRPDVIEPPFATDRMVVASTQPKSVVVLDGNPVFTLGDSGFSYRDNTSGNVQLTGWLESGWVRFGTYSAKVWSAGLLGVYNLDQAGDEVSMSVIDRAMNEFAIGTADLNSGIQAGPFDMNLLDVDLNVRLKMAVTTANQGDPENHPRLRYWQISAVPAPARVEEITVVIDATTAPEDKFGGQHHQTPLFIYNTLKGLESSGEYVVAQFGERQLDMRIDNVAVIANDLHDQQSFQHLDGNGWFEGNIRVRLLSRDTLFQIPEIVLFPSSGYDARGEGTGYDNQVYT